MAGPERKVETDVYQIVMVSVEPRLFEWVRGNYLKPNEHIGNAFARAIIPGINELEKQDATSVTELVLKPRPQAIGTKQVFCLLSADIVQRLKTIIMEDKADLSTLPMLATHALRTAFFARNPNEPEVEPLPPPNPLSQIFKYIPKPEVSGEGPKKTRLSKFGIPKTNKTKTRGNPGREDKASNPSTNTPQDEAETEGQTIYTAGEIKAFRQEHNLSQYTLAKAIGISRGIIADCESGRRTNKTTRRKITNGILNWKYLQ